MDAISLVLDLLDGRAFDAPQQELPLRPETIIFLR